MMIDMNTEDITRSFFQLTNFDLPAPQGINNLNEWIECASPYAILAHNKDDDPQFVYANQTAIEAFAYPINEIIGLKSKFSATEKDRTERSILLKQVKERGIAFNYSGPRVNKLGEIFQIHHGIVWNVYNLNQQEIGQAALFWREENPPIWFKSVIDQIQVK